MERPHRPPPLTIPPPPRSRTRVHRSRRPNPQQARQFKRWMFRAQIANDVAHVAAAAILLWVMSWFLYTVPFPLQYRTGPAAVTLLVVLSADILLDARSIVHAHDPWPGWALLLRLLLGAGLIAVFWLYIAIGDVFAPGFGYWGMNEYYGRVLAYMFLWGIGLWDMLFVLLCRHWLGKEVGRYGGGASGLFAGRGADAQRLGSAGAEGPDRIVPMDVVRDVEAARPGVGADGANASRVALPARMGVRREKNSVSMSVNSFASGSGSAASPPPVAPPPPAHAIARAL